MGLTTTKEWRWDAPGAHTLTAAVGSARILLRDFLLECGWSVIWEDAGAQKVVLRNSQAHGGSGCYVRILDDGSFTGGSRVARIDVYEAMTDIDTGTDTAGGGYFWKDRDGSGGPNAYTLHGDQRTMYFTCYVNGDEPPDSTNASENGRLCMAGMVGDIHPYIAGDLGVVCALSQVESPNTTATTAVASELITRRTSSGSTGASGFTLSRDKSLVVSLTNAALFDVSNSASGVGIGGGTSWAMDGNDWFLPALIVSEDTIRGRARGLYVPCNNRMGGGAPVGSVQNPMAVAAPLSLATLAGNATSGTATVSSGGRVFVERNISWDDL